MVHFKSDVSDKTKIGALIILIGLVLGRFLILFIQWVSSASKLKEQKLRSVSL
jgi:hypothetical protein